MLSANTKRFSSKMGKIEEFKLKNGIRVALVPMVGRKSVTVQVFIKIGAKFETTREAGMSHFVEHMAFKGTAKRPTPQAINIEADSKGAHFNAFTDFEMTSYYFTTIKENIPWAVEFLADILFNSLFDKKELEKEKGVIIEEIKMYLDDPKRQVSNDFTKFLYGKSKIGCWDITGSAEDIIRVKREDISRFRMGYLNPKEMVIVVAGDVGDKKKIKAEITKQFGYFENKEAKELPKVNILLNEEKEYFKKQNIQQAHFCLGVPTFSWSDKRKYALKILDIILAGSISSRLWQKIREEKGWAYYVNSFSEHFKETGFWAVQAGVQMKSKDQAIDLVKKELEDIKGDLMQDEVNRAKEYLLGTTKLVMDDVSFWAYFIGQKLLLENKIVLPEEELKKYQAIEALEIQDLSKNIFIKDDIKVALISK